MADNTVALSAYAEDQFLNHVLRNTAHTNTTLYMALFTVDPTAAGTMTNEATYTNYSRKAVTFGTAAASRSISNTVAVNFDQCTGSSNTITHYGIFDNATFQTGNMVTWGEITPNKVVTTDNTPSVAIGQVTISVPASNGCSDYTANAFLSLMFEGTAFTSPANVYLALASAAIIDADDGAGMDEVTGNSYERSSTAVTFGVPTGSSPSSTTTTNLIQFATPTGSWTIQAMAIVDGLTEDAGNILFYDNSLDQTAETDDDVQYSIGDLTVTVT